MQSSSNGNKQLTVKIKKSSSAAAESNVDYYSVVNMAEVKMEDSEDQQKYFSCQYPACTKMFNKKNQLQRHARTHTGERPFTCKLCDKSFTRIDALKRHKASVGHRKQTVSGRNRKPRLIVPNFCISRLRSQDMDGSTEHENEGGDSGNAEERFERTVEIEEVHVVDDDDDDEEEDYVGDVASFAQVTYATLDGVEKVDDEASANRPLEISQTNETKTNYCHICRTSFINRFVMCVMKWQSCADAKLFSSFVPYAQV